MTAKAILKIAALTAAAVMLSVFSSFAQSSGESSVDILIFKGDYEKKLKTDLQSILDRTLGQNRSVVSVTVDVTTEQEKRQKTTITKPADEELDAWMSPGVPLPPGLKGNNPKNSEVFESVSKPKIQSANVMVIIDDSLAAGIETEVEDLVKKSIGFASKVEVKRQAFTAQSSKFFDENKSYLLWAVLAFGMIAFFFGPVRSFMSSLMRNMAESKGRNVNIDMGGGKEGAGGNPLAAAAGAAGVPGMAPQMMAGGQMQAISAGSGSGEGGGGQAIVMERGGEVKVFKPFSFIKKSNIPNLSYLLQEESPEIVSLIMTYLPQEEAAEVMATMPIEYQAKIAMAMAQVKQASAESVLKAESDIKKKIDFLVGGIEKFIGILDKVDKSTREEILEALEKESPALADKVRKEIFTFDNVIDLDDSAFQVILREVKTDSLARAMTKAPEALLDKVKKNISSGAATLLQEEMNLAGYLTPMQIDEERNKIVNIIKKLEREGKVSIGTGKRRKTEKIDKIQKITEGVSDSGNASDEKPVAGKVSLASGEKMVGINDYGGRSSAKSISMAGLFKDNAPSGAAPAEAPVAAQPVQQAQREGMFVSRKPGAAPAQAQPAAKPATAAAPQSGADPKTEMTRLYNSGNTALKEKRFDDAIRDFTQCLKYNPNMWQVHQLIGNCYYAKGNIVETVRAYQKSLTINPNNPTLANWVKAYQEKAKAAK